MVKLKVYVRVIPESAYGANATTAPPRKFVVVVRDPAEWFIGTLAREAQRTYQRLYRHDLGKVKYLKDGDDNDLDPEQYVSDIFLNEGKAARDGLDQEAIIKIVQEQGHALRADSVVPDLTPAHYAQPPISRMPATSSLGKRIYDAIGESQELGAAKRSKLVEIPESQEVVPSVERSPELIQDTQREAPEVEVFDDAKEYHQDRAAAISTDLPPVTPSTSALPNGTTATKSPMQQASSSASRFKTGNHRDVYAYPESDIEDSQMATDRPTVVNGLASSHALKADSSQQEGIAKAVADFDAQNALFPMDLDEPPQSLGKNSATLSSQKRSPAASAKGGPSDSDESESDRDVPELKVPKARQQAAMDRKSTGSPQVKRQKTQSQSNGVARENKSNSPVLTKTSNKQQRSDSSLKKSQLKPALSLSPSRRTSGVVSELDSPGEQLSQALRDSATSQRLAEGVQAALGSKESTKRQRKKERLQQQRARNSGSSSAASSRPGSRDGLVGGTVPQKAATKKALTENQAGKTPETKAKVQATKSTLSKQASDDKPNGEPPKSFKEKLVDASARAVTEISNAVSARRKEDAAGSEDGSESEDDGAPLPSIENTPVAHTKASSLLPLPKWGSEPSEPKNAAVRASSAFIVPVGMTEEEYIRLRAKNESTPQPPKATPAAKRKTSTPAATAKAATSVAKDAVGKGKKVAEKATDMAQSVAKKAIAVESSSDGSGSGSSEDSDDGIKDNKKGKSTNVSTSNKSSSKSASKSTSPVKSRKPQPTKTSKSTEKATMPPPTPKGTAKRQESTAKQRVERSSSSSSAHTSSTSSQQQTSKAASSSSSASASPAPTTSKSPVKTPAKPKPQPSTATASKTKQPTPGPKKQATPGAASAAATAAKPIKLERPAVPMKRESALKALRAKINSEAASPAPSVAGSIKGLKKKQAPGKAILVESSSSESESESEDSSDEESDGGKKGPKKVMGKGKGKEKVNTPLRTVPGSGGKGTGTKTPDPSIRDKEREESSSSSGEESGEE